MLRCTRRVHSRLIDDSFGPGPGKHWGRPCVVCVARGAGGVGCGKWLFVLLGPGLLMTGPLFPEPKLIS